MENKAPWICYYTALYEIALYLQEINKVCHWLSSIRGKSSLSKKYICTSLTIRLLTHAIVCINYFLYRHDFPLKWLWNVWHGFAHCMYTFFFFLKAALHIALLNNWRHALHMATTRKLWNRMFWPCASLNMLKVLAILLCVHMKTNCKSWRTWGGNLLWICCSTYLCHQVEPVTVDGVKRCTCWQVVNCKTRESSC